MKLLAKLLVVGVFWSCVNVNINAVPIESTKNIWDTRLVDQTRLFSMINELKRENVKLRRAQSNWRQNIFAAAAHIRRLENTVTKLHETNLKWAQKINNIKADFNAMKIERVKNDLMKKKCEDIGLF